MIRSMTGFGRSAFEAEGVRFEVEVRSVNHRYLDLRVRLPRPLAAWEADVRERVQGRLGRGKVELSVTAPSGAAASAHVEVDFEAAERYIAAARELDARFDVGADLDVEDLLGLPGVARVVEADLATESAERALLVAVDEATEALARMREAEGANLDREFRERLETVEALTGTLSERSGSVQEATRERLRKRSLQLQEETGLLDEARLHQEIVFAADRLDVSEELSRLRSHVEQFRSTLDGAGAGKPVGRRLDFLLQELGREANTVGSKANDAELAHAVVELKTELERIREQVQNVE